MSINNTTQQEQPFSQYLAAFKEHLHQLFHIRSDIDELSTKRGLPPFLLREIMSSNPLSTYITTHFGGRGGHIHEGLALTAAASYESLPLSLGFGINWALFLQPLMKYADPAVAAAVISDLLENRKMGGLMITEPGHGSDALHMQTSYTEDADSCHLTGTKHWAGLTGWADYWLLTARKQNDKGELQRDIDFFICDVSRPQQNIVVEEVYENLGIYLLPYGRNRIDVRIPATHRLIPKTSGIKMMLDLLHRSRMQFPGMGQGFIQRMLDEAVKHCRERNVGGRSLFHYDQVQSRLASLQSAYTISSAMCLNSSRKAQLEQDLSGDGLEANSIKTYLTDLMQRSAQSLLQLVGAKGYRLNHIAGRAIVDSRPFQIFEGSNDILYIQIGEALQKQSQRKKERNLFRLLSTMNLTEQASERVKKMIDFSIDLHLPQRRLTQLGEIFSRISAMSLVIGLEAEKFNKELVSSAIEHLEQELAALLTRFKKISSKNFIENYRNDSSWLECY